MKRLSLVVAAISVLSMSAVAIDDAQLLKIIDEQTAGQPQIVKDMMYCMLAPLADGSEVVQLAEVSAVGTDKSILAENYIYAVVKPNGDLKCIGTGFENLVLPVLAFNSAEVKSGETMDVKGYGMVIGSIGSKGINPQQGGNLQITPGKKFSKSETAKGLNMMVRKDDRGEWTLQVGQKSIKKIVLSVGMTAKGVNKLLAYFNPPKLTGIKTQ